MEEPSATTANNLLCVQHIKIIDSVICTVELYEEIAYAEQGDRNGHTEMQY